MCQEKLRGNVCVKKKKDKKLVFVLSKYDFINSVHQLSYDTRKFSFDDPNQLTISFGHHKFCHHIANLTHSFPMHPFSTLSPPPPPSPKTSEKLTLSFLLLSTFLEDQFFRNSTKFVKFT